MAIGNYGLGPDYYHPMDREYKKSSGPQIRDIGLSVPEGGPGSSFPDAIRSVNANIRHGASTIEINLMPEHRGGAEKYGKEKRQALNELRMVNEVELTTHAPAGVGNLSGFSPRDHKFSEAMREESINEIKKAIKFAAETAHGGPIVVHTGEFPRSIYSVNDMDDYAKKSGKKLFSQFPGEDKKAPIYIHIGKTNEVHGIPKDTVLYKMDETENPEDPNARLKPYNWESALNDAKQKKSSPEKEFFNQFQKSQLLQHDAEIRRYRHEIDNIKEHMNELDKQINALKDNEDIGEEQKEMLSVLKRQKERDEKAIDSYRQTISSHMENKKRTQELIDSAKPIAEDAFKYSVDSAAKLGIYAMAETKELASQKKLNKDLFIALENIYPEMGYGSHPQELIDYVKKSRDRMIELLTKEKVKDPTTGEEVKNNLFKKGLTPQEAEAYAEKHIKAIFDTGHLNMWRKYWQGDEKGFLDWYKNQVEKLAKSGLLGHVHLADNFGVEDSHISPGSGNTPIKDAVDILRKYGYKEKFIVEPHVDQFGGLMSTWRLFDSPLDNKYGAPQKWNDIQWGWYGQRTPPYFTFGEYTPQTGEKNKKDWTLWSGTPLE